jgi:hypothetical protein
MKKKIFLLILVVGVSLGFLIAQERTITGQITSAIDGSVLPGVNVVLKGTSSGVVADSHGKYQIKVPEKGGTLVFSFIGYKSQEVVLGISNVLNITLSEDATQLSEVVITGYGAQKKKSLTGAVSVIQGKAAGVQSRGRKTKNADTMGAAYAQPMTSGEYGIPNLTTPSVKTFSRKR